MHLAIMLQQADERSALQAQHQQLLSEVEEWSQGEVVAVQAASAAALQQEREAVAHW
jgi:hypothetical protein